MEESLAFIFSTLVESYDSEGFGSLDHVQSIFLTEEHRMSNDFYADNGGNSSSETMPRPWSDIRNFHPYAQRKNIIFRFLFQECFTSVGSFWSTYSAAWQTGGQLRVSAPLSRYSPPFTFPWYCILHFIFYLLAEIFSTAESGVPNVTFGSQEPVTRTHCHQCSEISIELDVKYARF